MSLAMTDADRLACGCTIRYLVKHDGHGPLCRREEIAAAAAEERAGHEPIDRLDPSQGPPASTPPRRRKRGK